MKPKFHLPKLSELLGYRNKYVIERYCKEFDASEEQANDMFNEMLKFLWISVKNRLEQGQDKNLNAHIAIHHEMKKIDDMWHTFILFTKHYFEFSEKYFGYYIHHSPTTNDDPKPSEEEFKTQFETFLSYVYDHLGEKTLKKWFSEYFV